jgi:hypothetical protein
VRLRVCGQAHFVTSGNFAGPLEVYLARAIAVAGGTQGSHGEAQRELGGMKPIWETADFVRKLRARMRFGELSRAPLKLLRLELRGDLAACEWMARPPDPWDSDLPSGVGERHASWQALQDSLAVRGLLFSAMPDVSVAVFRVYRQAGGGDLELIISGTVSRREQVAHNIRSLAMRAKLCGFRFRLEGGVLGTLEPQEYAMSS